VTNIQLWPSNDIRVDIQNLAPVDAKIKSHNLICYDTSDNAVLTYIGAEYRGVKLVNASFMCPCHTAGTYGEVCSCYVENHKCTVSQVTRTRCYTSDGSNAECPSDCEVYIGNKLESVPANANNFAAMWIQFFWDYTQSVSLRCSLTIDWYEGSTSKEFTVHFSK